MADKEETINQLRNQLNAVMVTISCLETNKKEIKYTCNIDKWQLRSLMNFFFSSEENLKMKIDHLEDESD
jgi:hypothetical protein